MKKEFNETEHTTTLLAAARSPFILRDAGACLENPQEGGLGNRLRRQLLKGLLSHLCFKLSYAPRNISWGT
jgi:hypothetical protein